jgi:hypothetical protein
MLPLLSCIPEHDIGRHVNIEEAELVSEQVDDTLEYVEDENINHAYDFETLAVFEAGPLDDVGEELLEALSLSESCSDGVVAEIDRFSKSTIDLTSLQYLWEFKDDGKQFDDLSDLLRTYAHPDEVFFPDGDSAKARIRGGPSSVWFESLDIARLAPTNWLSGSCINQLGVLLQERFDVSNRCALFSTYALDRFYPGGRKGVDEFIRYHRKLQYGNRSLWLIPINRKEPAQHWVLTCVDLDRCTIYHFDSLAVRSTWQDDVDVSRFLQKSICFSLLLDLFRMYGS